jgi:parvulin-like peptidyl-prolyl isomerase
MKLLFPLIIGCSLLLNGCKAPDDPEKVLVTVNGTPVREKQVLEEADRRINAEAAHSATMGWVYDESERNVTRAFMRDDVLHTLIERQLIGDQLKADRIEITDREVDARFVARAKEHGLTVEQAEQEIKEQGKTLPDVKERIRWHTLGVEKLYQVHAKDKRQMTDAEALQLYTENPAEFQQEHERRVSRILINASPDVSPAVKKAARATAEDLLKRIKAGEAFATLAATFSEDPATKPRGGDRGWSPRGFVTAEGNDPFGEAAFGMKNVGDVSEVVETLDGYEIIKLTGIRPARQKSFDEVKVQILEKFKYFEIGNFWDQYAAGMWERARIEWSPKEKARREKREKEEREYNETMAKQAAREEENAKKQEETAPPQRAGASNTE